MNKRLALAKAVYPDREWFDDTGMCWMSRAERTGPALSLFDPENNADQFCDVLAWLLMSPKALGELLGTHVLCGETVLMEERVEVHHDCTAPGIRRAVVQAAERCA